MEYKCLPSVGASDDFQPSHMEYLPSLTCVSSKHLTIIM